MAANKNANKNAKAAKAAEAAAKAAAKAVVPLRAVDLQKHCEDVRSTLIALYDQSKNATHPVVQGTLREGFVRQVLRGFLGRSASWSSGQVVGPAPKNEVSGQMDLLLHDDLLPQVYMYDGALCLVPCDALFGAIEVKSNLTTGVGETGVLVQALDSIYDAVRVCQGAPTRSAFVIAAFYSGQKSGTLVKKIEEYIQRREVEADEFWPDAVVVLSGGDAHPKGFGLFREPLSDLCGAELKVNGLSKPLWVLGDGGSALAGLVALLSKHRIARSSQSETFEFAKYIFRPSSRSPSP